MTPSGTSLASAASPFGELRRLGKYTEREAAFLSLVATHSGYFLARQFDRFIGSAPGKARDAFVSRLLANRDAYATVHERGQALYHLYARPLYDALGQEDNRNRRPRPTHLIRVRLMALDFVLAHPAYTFLPYGQERADWLVRESQIETPQLPTKVYYARGIAGKTTRYFVDKFPAFLSDAPAASPVVSFCYIDEGQVTRKGFETYLEQYQPLFTALHRFGLVYLAATSQRVRATESMFRQFLSQSEVVHRRQEGNADLEQLLAFFPLRAAHEQRNYAALSKDDLTALRTGLQQFQGARIDEWFALWKQGGRAALIAAGIVPNTGERLLQAEFSNCVLPYDYSVFSAVRERRP